MGTIQDHVTPPLIGLRFIPAARPSSHRYPGVRIRPLLPLRVPSLSLAPRSALTLPGKAPPKAGAQRQGNGHIKGADPEVLRGRTERW